MRQIVILPWEPEQFSFLCEAVPACSELLLGSSKVYSLAAASAFQVAFLMWTPAPLKSFSEQSALGRHRDQD